jgi:heterodisulfide reductase subunit A-like polyferredoxin
MDVVTCDVLVVGSGAAGFATALTASVDGLDAIITEKEAFFGEQPPTRPVSSGFPETRMLESKASKILSILRSNISGNKPATGSMRYRHGPFCRTARECWISLKPTPWFGSVP